MRKENNFTKNNKKMRSRSGAGKRAWRKVEGVVQGLPKGYAFVVTDGGDFFVPASKLKGAINGDTVLALTDGNEGEVIKILKYNTSPVTGCYIKTLRGGCVVLDDKRYPFNVTITSGNAEIGDKVLVQLSRKERSKGVILKSLGVAGTLFADVAAVVAKLGLDAFGEKTIKEAAEKSKIAVSVCGRTDYREQPCFTIDGNDSKDFDDAVYAERTLNGYKLYVHIADVSEYVTKGSYCDRTAYKRGFSFYYGDNVQPMLPESLSNGACSLNENEDKLTLTAEMEVSGGRVINGSVKKSIIRSVKRMTYEAVSQVLDGNDVAGYTQSLTQTLKVLDDLSAELKRERDNDGNIDFDLAEVKFSFDGNKVVDMKKAERTRAHAIIEECMIAANEFVAQMYGDGSCFIFRSHRPPSSEKIERLNDFLLACGLKPLPQQPTSKDVANLLSATSDDKKECVSSITLRSMSKAEYSPTDCEHFGLASKHYCHFTSPIRRYTDLVVHRIIKASLCGEPSDMNLTEVTDICTHCNEREKKIVDAEREINDLYTMDYMYDKVGEIYDGTISGVSEWGVYVKIACGAEGLIKAERIGGKTKFDERSMTMKTHAGTYRIGDKIKVKLTQVSYNGLDFELCR